MVGARLERIVVSALVCMANAVVAIGCGGGGEASGSFGPSWSPDGQRILFSVDPAPSEGCGYGVCQFRIEAWVMKSTGEGAHKLAGGTSPVWSPDGRKIAFEGGSSRRYIYTVRVDGTDLRRLTRSGDPHGPAWSPDGKKIAFVSWSPGSAPNKLYVIDADGTGQRRLTLMAPNEASWSPNGAIAFTTFDGFFRIDADGRGLKKLFSVNSAASETRPSLSWDGTTLYFGSTRTGAGAEGGFGPLHDDARGNLVGSGG
jgi:Tol biopolymer transport system component